MGVLQSTSVISVPNAGVSLFLKGHTTTPDDFYVIRLPKDEEAPRRKPLTFLVLPFCGFLSFLNLEEIKDRMRPSRRLAWLTCWATGARGCIGISWDQLVHVNPNLESKKECVSRRTTARQGMNSMEQDSQLILLTSSRFCF